MRAAQTLVLVALLALTWGCSRSYELVFVIPENYTGLLKLRAERSQGDEVKPKNGVLAYRFSESGVCDI